MCVAHNVHVVDEFVLGTLPIVQYHTKVQHLFVPLDLVHCHHKCCMHTWNLIQPVKHSHHTPPPHIHVQIVSMCARFQRVGLMHCGSPETT